MGESSKQIPRRTTYFRRLQAARLAASRQHATPTRKPSGCQRWLGLLIAIPFTLCMMAWLLWSQAQIGRVLIWGRPASGTVVAVTPCDHATAANVTLVFTDAAGASHRVRHTSYTPGCFTSYHVGEALTVRYVPSDTGVLMTQPELDGLWISLLVFGLGDVVFLGGPLVLVLPVVSRAISAARATR